MRKVSALILGLVITGSLLHGAAVDDPSQLSPQRLTEYFNMRRNLDRNLQGGQIGPAISTGKKILKEFVKEDAYAAFCLACAYCAMDYDEDQENWESGLEHLEEAIDWGFLNVEILKTSKDFEKLRNDKENGFDKKLEDLVKYLEKESKKAAEKAKSAFPGTVKKKIEAAKKSSFELATTCPEGKEVKADQFAGKPLLVVVVRPRHDAVISSLPLYKELAGKAKAKGVGLLSAVYNYSYTDRLKKEAAGFCKAAGLGIPCALVDRSWTKDLGILNLPAHVLVSAQGKVLCRVDGTLTDWQLEALLDVLTEAGK